MNDMIVTEERVRRQRRSRWAAVAVAVVASVGSLAGTADAADRPATTSATAPSAASTVARPERHGGGWDTWGWCGHGGWFHKWTWKCPPPPPPPPPPPSSTPRIDIEMFVNTLDADTPTGPRIDVYGSANLTYVVTNTGNTVLTSITVTDDASGRVTCPKTTLAAGEKMTCTPRAVQVTAPGQVKRTAKVTGTNGARIVTDNDPVHWLGVTPPPPSVPKIDVEMFIDGDDADTPTGPVFTIICRPGAKDCEWGRGTFTYVVTNTGTATLTNVTLVEGSNPVTCPKSTLAPGEKMDCSPQQVIVLVNQFVNRATATGTAGAATVSDTDPVHYLGVLGTPPPPAGSSSIGDRVWLDQNNDGRQAMSGPGVFSEPAVSGVVVTLLMADGTPVASVRPQTTNQDGYYRFPNLTAGSYVVQFEFPCRYAPTKQLVGGDGLNSDGVSSSEAGGRCTAKTGVITLAENTFNPDVDYGLVDKS